MVIKLGAVLSLLFLFSCNSPEARLERLQHEVQEKYAGQDFFEIKLEEELLLLPLPPVSELSTQQKLGVEKLQKEANAIEMEKLGAVQKKQLAQLRALLDDFAANTSNPFFDPSRYALPESFKTMFAPEEVAKTNLLLGKIPDYYAEVEQRWQKPNVRFLPKALAKSQETVDLLNQLQAEWKGLVPSSEIQAAKAAVKDFISLCQSAVLQ